MLLWGCDNHINEQHQYILIMDYRFSSYSIVVPLESEPDNVFMMHGYTGAIDVLSKDIAEYLQNHKHFSKEEIPCSETTMEALEKRGYITKWTEEEEVEYEND